MDLVAITNLGDFVTPHICWELHSLGLSDKVKYFWKKVDLSFVLWTYDFDPDNYYLEGDKVIEHWNKAYMVPAYGTNDIEQCLPDLQINKNNGEYQISIGFDYGVRVLKEKRMCDLVARAALELLKAGTLSVEHFNRIINEVKPIDRK